MTAIQKSFVTLGMFIIDEFSFSDENGVPSGRTMPPQERLIGGGGTYAAVGARMWFPPEAVGMVVDKGHDFPQGIKEKLLSYGTDMWLFRDRADCGTTRALVSYRGEIQELRYLTRGHGVQITPNDFRATTLADPKMLHFVCSPARALVILSEVDVAGWKPITIYEPIPVQCIPEELPALKKAMRLISILSPNADEAFSLLSRPLPISKEGIEEAAKEFLNFGIGRQGSGWIVIRSGALGAYVKSAEAEGIWIDAYWTATDVERVVDVTGAGNSFLGGLAAGLEMSGGNVLEAALYGSVSASFTVEQGGLPTVTNGETWNGDQPRRRLAELRSRLNTNLGGSVNK